ncbi:unnamed protein product [Cuscuta campestris]|uniref:cytokinin riboside 5'-monophosphate phosphoribohydrolase n=1 Tax=Cuscuta campestris TaxID=132261 RepID=A0A484LQM2_9ASTE|nr:unnamed protein product [Cuscuta campestris]
MRAAATGEGSSGGDWLGKGDRRRCNSTAADDRQRKQRRRLDSTAMMVAAGRGGDVQWRGAALEAEVDQQGGRPAAGSRRRWIANLTVQESQYVISSADCSIGECVLVYSHSLGKNPKFMATAVDLGRELIRRRISLAYGGGNVGLQGAVASIVFNTGGLVRGFIPGYIATRRVYGPTYGIEHTVSSNYYKYFEMNHAVEAFIVLPGGVDTMEGLFTLISWASEGLHNRPIGLLNIDGYFNNLLKFLDDAVRQNFMASSQRKLFISSFSVDELLDKLEFAKAFPGPGVSYDEFVNPGRLDLELHL